MSFLTRIFVKDSQSIEEDIASRNQKARNLAAQMGMAEISTDLSASDLVGVIRDILHSRSDLTELHLNQIAADAGAAIAANARKDWPIYGGEGL